MKKPKKRRKPTRAQAMKHHATQRYLDLVARVIAEAIAKESR